MTGLFIQANAQGKHVRGFPKQTPLIELLKAPGVRRTDHSNAASNGFRQRPGVIGIADFITDDDLR